MSFNLGAGKLDPGHCSYTLCCDGFAAVTEVWLMGRDWEDFSLCKYGICPRIKLLHPLEHVVKS